MSTDNKNVTVDFNDIDNIFEDKGKKAALKAEETAAKVVDAAALTGEEGTTVLSGAMNGELTGEEGTTVLSNEEIGLDLKDPKGFVPQGGFQPVSGPIPSAPQGGFQPQSGPIPPVNQNMQNKPVPPMNGPAGFQPQNGPVPPVNPNMQNKPIPPMNQNMQNGPAMQNKPVPPMNQNMQNGPAMQNKPIPPMNQNMQNGPAMQNKPVPPMNGPAGARPQNGPAMQNKPVPPMNGPAGARPQNGPAQSPNPQQIPNFQPRPTVGNTDNKNAAPNTAPNTPAGNMPPVKPGALTGPAPNMPPMGTMPAALSPSGKPEKPKKKGKGMKVFGIISMILAIAGIITAGVFLALNLFFSDYAKNYKDAAEKGIQTEGAADTDDSGEDDIDDEDDEPEDEE